jgi:protein-S-isoprenylcysteine O-methyltransferase Ste14
MFTPAKSNNTYWNVSKTMLQTSVFWLLFLYALPKLILRLEYHFSIHSFQQLSIAGYLLFSLFSVLGLYSGYTMSRIGRGTPLPLDCPKDLVISGPYHWVRNPMALAGIGQGIAVGLILGSHFVVLYALVGAVLWHVFVRPMEEKDLESRFGDSYRKYKEKVRCWIPSFTPKQ